MILFFFFDTRVKLYGMILNTMHHKILVCVQKLACWLRLSYCAAIRYSAPCFLYTTLAAIISLIELNLTVFLQLCLLKR